MMLLTAAIISSTLASMFGWCTICTSRRRCELRMRSSCAKASYGGFDGTFVLT
ncbi:MAG: hypothetical protein IT372_29105 [Polyangiaceae bacterium]|nr:hypothetical protein [Polyangiaceae bacterium]